MKDQKTIELEPYENNREKPKDLWKEWKEKFQGENRGLIISREEVALLAKIVEGMNEAKSNFMKQP